MVNHVQPMVRLSLWQDYSELYHVIPEFIELDANHSNDYKVVITWFITIVTVYSEIGVIKQAS